QGRDLYHGLRLRIQRVELLEAIWTETIVVAFLQRIKRRSVELDVAPQAAEQASSLERKTALIAALLFLAHLVLCSTVMTSSSTRSQLSPSGRPSPRRPSSASRTTRATR